MLLLLLLLLVVVVRDGGTANDFGGCGRRYYCYCFCKMMRLYYHYCCAAVSSGLSAPDKTKSNKKRLNSLHVSSLRRILCIVWSDHDPNTEVLIRAGIPSIFTLLTQRRLRWFGHVHRKPDGRKHWALRPQKPLRLIRDGEVGGGGGSRSLYLTPTRYTVTTRMTMLSGGHMCEPF